MSVHVRPQPIALDMSIIVEAALELMNEIGIDALTTRRLAEKLGVKGPALYWHFRNKDELLAKMCERLLTTSLDRTAGDSWQDWIRAACMELRRTLGAVRDGARLVAFAEWTDIAKTDLIERVERPLIDSGMDRQSARRIVGATNAYTIGWVATESKSNHRSFMASQFDIDEAFRHGLDALVNGLSASV